MWALSLDRSSAARRWRFIDHLSLQLCPSPLITSGTGDSYAWRLTSSSVVMDNILLTVETVHDLWKCLAQRKH